MLAGFRSVLWRDFARPVKYPHPASTTHDFEETFILREGIWKRPFVARSRSYTPERRCTFRKCPASISQQLFSRGTREILLGGWCPGRHAHNAATELDKKEEEAKKALDDIGDSSAIGNRQKGETPVNCAYFKLA